MLCFGKISLLGIKMLFLLEKKLLTVCFLGCTINSVGGNTSILSFIYKKT